MALQMPVFNSGASLSSDSAASRKLGWPKNTWTASGIGAMCVLVFEDASADSTNQSLAVLLLSMALYEACMSKYAVIDKKTACLLIRDVPVTGSKNALEAFLCACEDLGRKHKQSWGTSSDDLVCKVPLTEIIAVLCERCVEFALVELQHLGWCSAVARWKVVGHFAKYALTNAGNAARDDLVRWLSLAGNALDASSVDNMLQSDGVTLSELGATFLNQMGAALLVQQGCIAQLVLGDVRGGRGRVTQLAGIDYQPSGFTLGLCYKVVCRGTVGTDRDKWPGQNITHIYRQFFATPPRLADPPWPVIGMTMVAVTPTPGGLAALGELKSMGSMSVPSSPRSVQSSTTRSSGMLAAMQHPPSMLHLPVPVPPGLNLQTGSIGPSASMVTGTGTLSTSSKVKAWLKSLHAAAQSPSSTLSKAASASQPSSPGFMHVFQTPASGTSPVLTSPSGKMASRSSSPRRASSPKKALRASAALSGPSPALTSALSDRDRDLEDDQQMGAGAGLGTRLWGRAGVPLSPVKETPRLLSQLQEMEGGTSSASGPHPHPHAAGFDRLPHPLSLPPASVPGSAESLTSWVVQSPKKRHDDVLSAAAPWRGPPPALSPRRVSASSSGAASVAENGFQTQAQLHSPRKQGSELMPAPAPAPAATPAVGVGAISGWSAQLPSTRMVEADDEGAGGGRLTPRSQQSPARRRLGDESRNLTLPMSALHDKCSPPMEPVMVSTSRAGGPGAANSLVSVRTGELGTGSDAWSTASSSDAPASPARSVSYAPDADADMNLISSRTNGPGSELATARSTVATSTTEDKASQTSWRTACWTCLFTTRLT